MISSARIHHLPLATRYLIVQDVVEIRFAGRQDASHACDLEFEAVCLDRHAIMESQLEISNAKDNAKPRLHQTFSDPMIEADIFSEGMSLV